MVEISTSTDQLNASLLKIESNLYVNDDVCEYLFEQSSSNKFIPMELVACSFDNPVNVTDQTNCDLLSSGKASPRFSTNEENPCVVESCEGLSVHEQCCSNLKLEAQVESTAVNVIEHNVTELCDNELHLSDKYSRKVCTNERTVCVVESYESLFEQCSSNQNLVEFNDFPHGNVTNVKQEPGMDACLTDKDSPSVCTDDDSVDVLKSQERLHSIIKRLKVETNQRSISQSDLSTMALNFQSDNFLEYSLDKKLCQRPFITLKKLDCLRCYEQSHSTYDRPGHAVWLACSRNDNSSQRSAGELQESATKTSEFSDQRCLPIGSGRRGSRQLQAEHSMKVENDETGNDRNSQKSVSKSRKNNVTHQCEVCSKVFAYRGALRRHVASHSDEKRHKCDQCSKSFKYMCGLQEHVRQLHSGDDGASRHAKPLHACYHCRRLFSSRGSLRNHLIRFTSKPSEISHECVDCGKVFMRPDHLRRHVKSHAGLGVEKSHVCETCGKAYTRSDRLKLHVGACHTGNERLLRCTYAACDRAFNRSDALAVHSRVHRNEKPYICSDCGSTYVSKSALVQHMLRAHPKEELFD